MQRFSHPCRCLSWAVIGNPDGDSRDNLQEQTDGTDPTQADDNPDSDADGLPDAWERQYFTLAPQPPEPTPDPLRFDANDDPDGDGLNNQQELTLGTAPNSSDAATDVDNDGLPDAWERLYFKTQADIVAQTGATDFDMDGLNNLEEFQKKTNPLDSDTDDDSLPDGWEVQYGLSPLSVEGSHGAQGDPDGDTLKNLIEYQFGSSPINADTDGDLLPDWWEFRNQTSLISNLGQDGPTGDIDHDGFTNLEEFRVLSDPQNASSYPGSGGPAQTFGESGTNTPDPSFAAFLAYRGRWLSFRSTLTHYYPYVIEKIYYEREVTNSSPPPLNDGFNGDADPNENLQDPGDPRDIPDWTPTYWIDCDEGSPGAVERIGTQPDYLCHSPTACNTVWEEFKESIYTVETAYPGESGKLEIKDTSLDFSRSSALAAMESLPMYQGNSENGWMGDGRRSKIGVTVTSQWNVPYEVVETRECDGDSGIVEEQSWPYKRNAAYMDQIQMRYQCNQPAPTAQTQPFVLVKREVALCNADNTYLGGGTPAGPETVTVLGSMELRIEEGQMISSQASANFPLPEGVSLQGGTILLTSPPVDPGTMASYDLLPVEIDQQNYNAADGIRFCRWLDAFPNEQFDNQAADKDRDRFRIKIAGNIPNLTKAKIKATDLHGAVIDGQFVNKTTDGDYEVEMKAEGGSMVSTPILLVSDGDDDKKYNGKGTDDGNDDQTLLADFDSKIVVTFPELGNAQAEFKASKAKGEIKLNAFFLSLDGSLPSAKRAVIELHLRKAREIYRQTGTKVTITNISPFTLPSIWATYLGERKNSNGEVVEQANVISLQERTLLINELRTQTDHPIPSGQMLITFIDATIQSGGSGRTAGFTAEDFAPPCVISVKGDFADFHISTAHETGHMLGVRHPVEGQVIPHRLMTSSSLFVGPRYNWNHSDSKRLIESELATMKAAGGFYVQLP